MALHVVFGAGQIGPHLARLLKSRGHDVRIVRRTPSTEPGTIAGDAMDPVFTTEVTRGASAVYHCMNPAYSVAAWRDQLPRILEGLITGAGRNGARLVVLDNLYMLGRPGEEPMNEDTPSRPASPKGEIRARLAERLFDAHRRGDVQAVAGRASDFYGPRGRGTYFGDAFWPRVLAGKSAQSLHPLDVPHTWHYTIDVARGLAALGEAEPDVCGRWWMLPCAPPLTIRQMIERLAVGVGHPLKIERVPPFVLAALGVVVPVIRELREMRYEFETPFVCDDRRFRERFEVLPTDPVAGARATVEWARATYGSRGAPGD